MLNNRKRIIVSISILAIIFIALIGITYAYYAANVTGNTSENPSLNMTSGYLSITYTEGQEFIPSESDGTITAGKAYTKTFTVKNTGVIDANYGVWFKDVVNPFTRTQDWTYELSNGETVIASGTVPTEDKAIISARPLAVGESETLTLSVTYAQTEEDQSADMNKSLEFNISVSQDLSAFEKAKKGTLLYAIRENNIVSDPLTIPGQAPSTSDEAVLASTEDDYGTSYYFRGSVLNNFVNYSGMCWRIVRVQGDGTVKLALADENGTCNADTYSTNNTTSAIVDGRTNIAYKANTVNDATDFLFANSDIPLILSTWAETNSLDMSELVETEWCNDTALAGLKGNRINYYGAYKRLNPQVYASEPSLKCDTKGIDGSTGTEAQATKYKNVLGILSADEVVFAGATDSEVDYNWYNYLLTNANEKSIYCWTISPSIFMGGARVWQVDSTNGLSGDRYLVSNPLGSVRPSVVIRSDALLDTTVEGQIGTQTNPYVVVTETE